MFVRDLRPILFLLVLTLLGCSSKSDSNSTSSQTSFLLKAAENTAPTITPVAVARAWRFEPFSLLVGSAYATPPMPKDCKATYGYMCLGWEVYTLLRDFDPELPAQENSEDGISTENMYVDINLAGQAYEQFAASAEPMPVTTTVASPFDFAASNLGAELYDHATSTVAHVNAFGYQGEVHMATREDGTSRHFLIAVGAAEGPVAGLHKVVMQGKLDSISGDIELNFVQFSQYPPGTPMGGMITVMRSYIKGNANTHQFLIAAVAANTGSGPAMWNWSSIQGAGFSKGSGKHFLVFYRGTNASSDNNGVKGPGVSGGHFCIAADTTKADFGAGIYAKAQGYELSAIPTECAADVTELTGVPVWNITDTQTVEPKTMDIPVKADSALFKGTGKLGLGLVF